MSSSRQAQQFCSDSSSPLEALLNGREAASGSYSVYKLVESLTFDDLARMARAADESRESQMVAAVLGVSPSTVRRRFKHPGKLLNPDQGGRALRFSQVLTKAQDILGDRLTASRWFFEPAIGLGGEAPARLLLNPFGYELVVDLMTRIEYGVYH
ncbi:putative toxin-antitoxin system antitoxin component, TIGR02293 family [Pseudomonas peli]|uniref:Toxin-antitoxin system antitoxin component, TIGR02293 family n=1 Tax=Pseudomonas peli TaxID=592361 RepID=A0AB37ZF01_9PSED|nr:antitoxin Xre/MbcA/ParS toxin-binding domain-containing protein [Pseudomonas peli]NMZ71229.1 DUF2384 domain-containing protein [Pseudomonas peli]SCW86646.1 putative toxin-antitoxin system antitoxin component, TIGR02293 family [Pseudomonas peli]